MIQKVKNWLIGFAVIFVAIAVVTVNIQHKSIIKLRADKLRLIENVDQLLQESADNTAIILAKDEVNGRIKHERDSLARIVKTKPKFIEKIIYQTVTVKDTLRVPVLVTNPYKNVWLLQDSGKCFKYASKLILQDNSITATRQNFEYKNKTTQVFYKKAPFIWFIRIGKWQYKQQVSSECGDSKTESITFIKK